MRQALRGLLSFLALGWDLTYGGTMKKTLTLSVLTLALLSACSVTGPGHGWRYSVPEQPEAASGLSDKPGWSYTRQAVAAANPLATDAGLQILRAGGSALDAAIAVQLVLAGGAAVQWDWGWRFPDAL